MVRSALLSDGVSAAEGSGGMGAVWGSVDGLGCAVWGSMPKDFDRMPIWAIRICNECPLGSVISSAIWWRKVGVSVSLGIHHLPIYVVG